MGDYDWVYLENKEQELLFIGAEDKGIVTSNVMRSRLEVIQNAFFNEFNLEKPGDWRKNFHGDIEEFKEFKSMCDIFIKQWKQAEEIIGTAELIDLFGIFQQIFNLFINIIGLNFFGDSRKDIIERIQTKVIETVDLPEFKHEAEIHKIRYSEKNGWNIFNLNAAGISNPSVALDFLLKLTSEIKKLFSEKLGKMLALDGYSKEIFPFLLNNWNLIKKLNIEKKILNIFLKS